MDNSCNRGFGLYKQALSSRFNPSEARLQKLYLEIDILVHSCSPMVDSGVVLVS